jgi:hypothetical protein
VGSRRVITSETGGRSMIKRTGRLPSRASGRRSGSTSVMIRSDTPQPETFMRGRPVEARQSVTDVGVNLDAQDSSRPTRWSTSSSSMVASPGNSRTERLNSTKVIA